MKRGLFEFLAFASGYLALALILHAPSWRACIGGWVLAMWVSLGMKK